MNTSYLFGAETSVKIWAPYIDLATKELEHTSATKSIILVNGVRHLRQMLSNKLSPSSFRMKIGKFIEAARASSTTAKIVLCSIIPNAEQEMIDGAAMLNSILKEMADGFHGSRVVYANTAIKFTNTVETLKGKGVHPKVSHIGRMANTIMESLRPKSGMEPRRHHPLPPRLAKPQHNIRYSQQSEPISQQQPPRPVLPPPPAVSVPPPVAPYIAPPVNTCGTQNIAYPGSIPGSINPLHALLSNMLSPLFNQWQNSMAQSPSSWLPRQTGQMNP